MYWVYIVHCADGTYYTGCAANLNRRVLEHKQGKGAKYTRSRRPVYLLVAWVVDNRSHPQQLEALIKKLSKLEKIKLVSEPCLLLAKAKAKGLGFSIQTYQEGESELPIVQIELIEGRTVEQKQAMVEKVTQAIVETAGAKPENVSIIIREMSKENYAKAGKLFSTEQK